MRPNPSDPERTVSVAIVATRLRSEEVLKTFADEALLRAMRRDDADVLAPEVSVPKIAFRLQISNFGLSDRGFGTPQAVTEAAA
jgi:hypothetical protein